MTQHTRDEQGRDGPPPKPREGSEMTQATILSAEVQAKAKTLVELRSEWATVRDARHGWRRIVMPSLSTPGHVYYVDPRGDACSCPAGRRGLMCAHRLAARTIAHRDALAAWVDDQEQAPPAPKPLASYDAIYGQDCAERGCTADAQDGEPFCRRHQLCDAF